MVSVLEQIERFIRYKEWLKSKKTLRHYGAILEESMKKDKEIIGKFADKKAILSFFHCRDRVLTARLAASYFIDSNDDFGLWLSERDFFDRLHPVDEIISMPSNGFSIFEPYDDGAFGKKFQGLPVATAKEKIREQAGDSWQGMTAELFQFLFIANPNYLYAMDGANYPYLSVAGFHLSDRSVPCIGCRNRTVIIGCLNSNSAGDNYGAAFSKYLVV